MKLHFLDPLYAQPGPVASVFLDTSRDLDEPDRALDLRWRHLRDSLLAHDADQATVDAIEGAVGSDRAIAGRHGQAIFAAHGRIVLAECVPEPPSRDSARYGIVPDALPLALQHAPDIPYAVVAIRRVHVPDAGGDEELEVDWEAGRWPMSSVAPARAYGPTRRIPLDDWPTAAERLLAELRDSVETEGTEVIVVSGDPWAANVLKRSAPRKLADRFTRLKNGDDHRQATGRALLEAELDQLFADRLPDGDLRRLDAFRARRTRHRDDTEGIAATVEALQRGQAQALVLTPSGLPERHLWVGAAPTDLALTGEDLSAFGVDYYWEEPVGPALLRAAAGTQAELIAVPPEEPPLRDGLGVLPRYPAG